MHHSPIRLRRAATVSVSREALAGVGAVGGWVFLVSSTVNSVRAGEENAYGHPTASRWTTPSASRRTPYYTDEVNGVQEGNGVMGVAVCGVAVCGVAVCGVAVCAGRCMGVMSVRWFSS